jgi:hypothetical protein
MNAVHAWVYCGLNRIGDSGVSSGSFALVTDRAKRRANPGTSAMGLLKPEKR